MKTIEEYLKYWDSVDGLKPQNEEIFIKLFVEFMKNKDAEHYEFHGDNDYCGYTAIVYDIIPRHAFGSDNFGFEFAYSEDEEFVKVFTSYHRGFWSPEYIDLKGEEAQDILSILKSKFVEWGGFKAKELAK